MNFLKRNKNIIIALAIFFGIMLLSIQVKNMLIPNEGAAVYGNRLDGKVAISKDIDKKIQESLGESATDVKVRTSGRIINITYTVYGDVSKDAAKSYAQKALEVFTSEEKSYYDFQFYVLKDGEGTDFPIIGYRIQNSDKITWTKDR